jgi:hypothetical protein
MSIFEEFRKRGYAPGDYCNKCSKCGQTFVGDKRAWTCFSCAVEEIGNVAKPDACPQLCEGWRDVNKELPNDYDDVLIANHRFVSVGWCAFDEDKKWHIRTVIYEGEVLYWRPLPDPPVFL